MILDMSSDSNDLFVTLGSGAGSVKDRVEALPSVRRGDKVRDRDGNVLTVEETDGKHVWVKKHNLWMLVEWLVR